MPLSILLPLVVFGILLIVVLVRLMSPTPVLVLRGEPEAFAIWDRRHPDLPAHSALLDAGGRFALVETDAGRGLIWTLGVDPVTRLLPETLRVSDTSKGLALDIGDFTAPRINLEIAGLAERAAWRLALEGTSA